MCFLWVPPTSVHPRAREYAGSGIRTNGTARFIAVSVHCQKVVRYFWRNTEDKSCFIGGNLYVFPKGEQFRANVFRISPEILWKNIFFQGEHLRKMFVHGLFLPFAGTTSPSKLTYLRWHGRGVDVTLRCVEQALDGELSMILYVYVFHIFCIVPASSMWLFDSSNWGVFVNPWKGRSWGYFFFGRTGAHCDGWGSMFG